MFSASKTAAPVSGAYQISNSVRLRSAASAYFSRTLGSTSNRKTFTYSFWVKRGTIGSSTGQVLFGASDNVTSSGFIYFNTVSVGSTDCFAFQDQVTGTQLTTTQVFRDPSAWYHFVVLVDTTQATSIDRVKMYVNGTQITSFSTATYPSQNANTNFNYSSLLNTIGDYWTGYLYFFDGYMADINFIDGQALTPSSFGQINPTTGVWQPIKYAGSYGTNGFHLAFNNGTSTTTLGNDSSGNGNNWTPNNISLTAGSTYDWMLDSPTPYAGTSYGVGNYCVMNPLLGNLTVSGANLDVSDPNVGYAWRAASFVPNSGKWYWEYVNSQSGIIRTLSGLSQNPYNLSGQYLGVASTDYGFVWHTGEKYNNGTITSYGSAATSPGDIIMTALDLDAGKIWWGLNGVWFASGSPSTGVNPGFTGVSGSFYLPIQRGTQSSGTYISASVNHGQRPFAYTPPTGYKTLCTQNLPVVTVYNGAAYMAATTYTGSGSTQTISGAAFQPDLVWVKCRSVANHHVLYDSVRGAGSGKALSSSLTAQEGLGTTDADSKYGYVSSLNSNGFSVAGGSLGQQYVNTSAATYIGWQWKAGGTAVTNTAGSITSQVSANTTAGFSVVTYTGNGNLSATVGHGLGVAPAMVINKGRSDGFYLWRVYHQSITSGNMLLLNSTLGAIAINSDGGISSVGSSTFGFSGGTPAVNATGSTYVAYCFAAIPSYSAFGSYTGNGSTDGPFVYCGFRPRYVMVKCSSSDQGGNADWRIQDSSRDPYNVVANMLFADLSLAESTGNALMDLVSNGFKIRGTSTGQNASGGTYIYACFAESPFQYSLAR